MTFLYFYVKNNTFYFLFAHILITNYNSFTIYNTNLTLLNFYTITIATSITTFILLLSSSKKDYFLDERRKCKNTRIVELINQTITKLN